MSLTTSEMTPADLAAVTGNNNNGAFGMDGGAWWIIILFLFVFMGWGGNGWGNNGMNGFNGAGAQGALTRQDLCMDMNFNDLKNSVSSISSDSPGSVVKSTVVRFPGSRISFASAAGTGLNLR